MDSADFQDSRRWVVWWIGGLVDWCLNRRASGQSADGLPIRDKADLKNSTVAGLPNGISADLTIDISITLEGHASSCPV